MFIFYVKFDTKYDQILQNSSQEPSMSSKHDYFLDEILFMLGIYKLKYTSRLAYSVNSKSKIWYQRWPSPPKLQSGTINVLQIWLCSWCTYNHARVLKIWIQLRNNKLCWFMMSNLILGMIQSSKTPVTNHSCPPSMTVFLINFFSC